MTATPPQTAETAGQAVTADRVKRLVRDYAIVWVTIALFVGLAVTTDNFLSTTNLRNILDQQATVLIVASVTTLTVIAGGFDVSLGAIFVVAPLA